MQGLWKLKCVIMTINKSREKKYLKHHLKKKRLPWIFCQHCYQITSLHHLAVDNILKNTIKSYGTTYGTIKHPLSF